MNTYLRNFMKFSRFNFSNGAARIKRGEIVNYEYRVKEMPDFSKVLPGAKLKLKLQLARVPTKIREIPYNGFI